MANPSLSTYSPVPVPVPFPLPLPLPHGQGHAQQPIKARNILPLPRRPLRDRLPPEVAATIQYPPSNPSLSRVWPFLPDTPPRDELLNLQACLDSARAQQFFDANGLRYGANGHRNGDVPDTSVPRSPPEIQSRNRNRSKLAVRPDNTKSFAPDLASSTTSSVDGLDTFESNNKKKRKVPTNGDQFLHNNLNECSPPFSASTASPPTPVHHGTNSASCSSLATYSSPGHYSIMGTGISGSGRGTLAARSRHVRSPLRDVTSGNLNWARTPRTRPGSLVGQAGDKTSAGGIISSAIADAEKTHSVPQPQPVASHRLSSDFSFRCQSQVPGSGLLDHMEASQSARTPELPSPNPTTAAQHGSPNFAPDPAEVERKNRRKLAREYADAARDRKHKTQLNNNYHNPPKEEDLWICEFCEYERIFGEPPRALIRQYEIRDRQLRLQEAERRRLLEKAKAKSRKAKKAANGNAKPTSRVAQQHGGQPVDPQHSLSGDHHPDEGNGGWGPEDPDHHLHGFDHDSDHVEEDSDEGPPDLVPEYPNMMRPHPPANIMVQQAVG